MFFASSATSLASSPSTTKNLHLQKFKSTSFFNFFFICLKVIKKKLKKDVELKLVTLTNIEYNWGLDIFGQPTNVVHSKIGFTVIIISY